MELPEKVRDCLKKGDDDEHGEPSITHSIIMETKNLHVESTLETFVGQRQRKGYANKYTLGPLSVHQLEKHHRAAEIITLCPER
jgi:hypothetical protein